MTALLIISGGITVTIAFLHKDGALLLSGIIAIVGGLTHGG